MFLTRILQDFAVFGWDFVLSLTNILAPLRPVGHVVPEGHPGAGGHWPEYMPPKEGDSRCSCPGLNAMANHGILPRNGKGIPFKDLGELVRNTYNIAPSFCFFVSNFSANMLKRNYRRDTFDLAELDVHNGIEHDGSLTREDSVHVPDQGTPHRPFIEELLASATGKDKEGNTILTIADLSRYSAKRRVDARTSNPSYSLSFFHKMFASSNSSLLLTIYGGRVDDLEVVLLEERITEGWESRVRSKMGLTIAALNMTVLRVEMGIDEKQYAQSIKQI
ncbi:Chloroperoxidase [Crucibulum laeve]|uniref:Chloroperoxidase n=1 Tax=Crucibulum laeve TaxID=68775 RepID=A0A5C3LDU7_9AGAR|nr:Chloroperoxidase [Crucibulum laeve]